MKIFTTIWDYVLAILLVMLSSATGLLLGTLFDVGIIYGFRATCMPIGIFVIWFFINEMSKTDYK